MKLTRYLVVPRRQWRHKIDKQMGANACWEDAYPLWCRAFFGRHGAWGTGTRSRACIVMPQESRHDTVRGCLVRRARRLIGRVTLCVTVERIPLCSTFAAGRVVCLHVWCPHVCFQRVRVVDPFVIAYRGANVFSNAIVYLDNSWAPLVTTKGDLIV